MVEIFTTLREFKNRFPSDVYICSNCGHPSINPYFCIYCKAQSNGFFTKNYKYIIKELSDKVHTIFKPIDLKED